MAQYDMSTNVMTYLNIYPYDYEDRIQPVRGVRGKLIDYYTASLEDIVIAKLYSHWDKDLADITSSAVIDHLNRELLDHLAKAEDEAKANALNEYRYREFLDNYADFRRRFHP